MPLLFLGDSPDLTRMSVPPDAAKTADPNSLRNKNDRKQIEPLFPRSSAWVTGIRDEMRDRKGLGFLVKWDISLIMNVWQEERE